MPTVVFKGLRLPKREVDQQPSPFAVPCLCGAMLEGERLAQQQVVRCFQCGAERFILPHSPLPDVKTETAESGSGLLRTGPWFVWRWPLVGGALALALGLVVVVLILQWAAKPAQDSGPVLTVEEQADRHVQAGQNAINGGSFHQATRELSAALELASSAHWSAARRREVLQLQRQAALVADLLTETPSEIIRNSLGVPDAEWQTIFARNYAHRSIILDDSIHKDAAGYHLSFRMLPAGSSARWDLSELAVLKPLDLFQPRRILLGVRLAGIRREAKNGWVVLPEPDSGVLFTDPRFFVGLSVAVDREMEQTLKAQQEWVK